MSPSVGLYPDFILLKGELTFVASIPSLMAIDVMGNNEMLLHFMDAPPQVNGRFRKRMVPCV